MSLTPELFAYARDLLREHSGNVLEGDKAYFVETRLAPLARQAGARSLGDFLRRLRAGQWPDLKRQVVEALVVQETYFFRDEAVFDALHEVVLPGLIRLRAGERRLALWSAACASGQEAYSLAILLRERLPDPRGWEVRLVASDLSAQALERARQGRYTDAEIRRGLPEAYRARYFRSVDRGGEEPATRPAWQVRDDLRGMVEFRQIHLGGPWPELPAMDLIMLRNVLIYFDATARARILAKAIGQLRPGGVLVLGGGESLPEGTEGVERESAGRASWFRRPLKKV